MQMAAMSCHLAAGDTSRTLHSSANCHAMAKVQLPANHVRRLEFKLGNYRLRCNLLH
jgi:hypothetical protein